MVSKGGVISVDTYVRHMGGSPGDYRTIGDDITIKGIMVNNDSPNQCWVVVGTHQGVTTPASYLLKVPARMGRQIPLPAVRQVTVVADPAGVAVAPTDEVTIVASPEPVPGSAWSTTGQTVALSGPGTASDEPLYTQAVGPGAAANDPAFAAIVGPTPGEAGLLANDAAVAAGGSVNTGEIALFRSAVVMVTVSAATNVQVLLRGGSGAWYPIGSPWDAPGAASNAIAVPVPSTGIQVSSSAACNWTVEYQTAQ